jgi:hypothetical protein
MFYRHSFIRRFWISRHGVAFFFRLFVLANVTATPVWSQNLMISEFMAANNSGLRDQDKEFSDWIEIYNPDRAAVSLAGWYLTDDPVSLTKWRFPDVMIPGQSFVIVFASAKDRTNPQGELHANFSLDRDGEYLALVRPDGTTKASEFAPAYPRQLSDISYGISMTNQTQVFVAPEAAARMFFPANDQLGLMWTQPAFNDSTWTPVTLGVGYDRPQPGQTNNTIEPEDVTKPGRHDHPHVEQFSRQRGSRERHRQFFRHEIPQLRQAERRHHRHSLGWEHCRDRLALHLGQ